MQRQPSSAGLEAPATFGATMATGIVSITANLLGFTAIAHALLLANVALYAALALLTILRVVRHTRTFIGDATDHRNGPGYFTLVAGTAVLGTQCAIVAGMTSAGVVLGAAAVVLWFVLTYGVFGALTVKADKPPLEQGIGGTWLLAVVATQSLAVLAGVLAARAGPPHRLALNFFALSMWLWGGMLYIWLMSLIFYRTTFFPLSPADVTPPYWINMGAMAISTLAGSRLALNAADAPLLLALLPFLKGFTIFYWAAGTWWIPMLLWLGVWRYLVRRYPLTYDPAYWSVVFPLGMYAAATHELIAALGLDFLNGLPPLFFWVAVAAWVTVSCGLARALLRRRSDARMPGDA